MEKCQRRRCPKMEVAFLVVLLTLPLAAGAWLSLAPVTNCLCRDYHTRFPNQKRHGLSSYGFIWNKSGQIWMCLARSSRISYYVSTEQRRRKKVSYPSLEISWQPGSPENRTPSLHRPSIPTMTSGLLSHSSAPRQTTS